MDGVVGRVQEIGRQTHIYAVPVALGGSQRHLAEQSWRISCFDL